MPSERVPRRTLALLGGGAVGVRLLYLIAFAREYSPRRDADHYQKLEDFSVQKMVHSLAVDTASHRVYAPEQQENGQPVARMIVYEAVEPAPKR